MGCEQTPHEHEAMDKAYYTTPRHEAVGVENSCNHKADLINIGKNGENITIAVFISDKIECVIGLLESLQKKIPGFKGKALLGAAGISAEASAYLHFCLKKFSFECVLVDFKESTDTAVQKNKLYAMVDTDWLMTLDDGMRFIDNPLPQIQKSLNFLGCKFLGLPFFSKKEEKSKVYGAHLKVGGQENRPTISLTSITDRDESDELPYGFLCTGLLMEAAVINREAFLALNGFDGNIFAGFENLEFSLRLFQKGYKVGCCGATTLHSIEPVKFVAVQKEQIEKSVEYFEGKYVFKIPSEEVSKYIKKPKNPPLVAPVDAPKKKKIALVVDRPDWALGHIADQVEKNLKDYFDFVRFHMIDIDNVSDIFFLAEDCDLIHFFWRGIITVVDSEYAVNRMRNLGMTEKEFFDRYIKSKAITTEVYDHLLLESDYDVTEKLFNNEHSLVTSYAVSSKKLEKIYAEQLHLKSRPTAVLQDGVDLGMFEPQNLERFENIAERTIRFGWVGNSNWQCGDLKGIGTIIQPAIRQLQEEGYNIELITSDRNKRMIPHHEMPDYYAGIDCYICASTGEGTPNPVLESMACGIPVISTDVGIVPEALGEKQKKYILKERSVECLKAAIRDMVENPGLFMELSSENLESIKVWDWKIKAAAFKDFFDDALRAKRLLNGKEF